LPVGLFVLACAGQCHAASQPAWRVSLGLTSTKHKMVLSVVIVAAVEWSLFPLHCRHRQGVEGCWGVRNRHQPLRPRQSQLSDESRLCIRRTRIPTPPPHEHPPRSLVLFWGPLHVVFASSGSCGRAGKPLEHQVSCAVAEGPPSAMPQLTWC
jgi:hypothetical protein